MTYPIAAYVRAVARNSRSTLPGTLCSIDAIPRYAPRLMPTIVARAELALVRPIHQTRPRRLSLGHGRRSHLRAVATPLTTKHRDADRSSTSVELAYRDAAHAHSDPHGYEIEALGPMPQRCRHPLDEIRADRRRGVAAVVTAQRRGAHERRRQRVAASKTDAGRIGSFVSRLDIGVPVGRML